MSRDGFSSRREGANILKQLDEAMKIIDSDKWMKKRNSVINKALRSTAKTMLPKVKGAVSKDTGVMASAIYIGRVRKGGGVRISTPKKALLKSEGTQTGDSGYYPASIEYGFRHAYTKKKINGTNAIRDIASKYHDSSLNQINNTIKTQIEKRMKRHIRSLRRGLK